jgi:hypothetical protein
MIEFAGLAYALAKEAYEYFKDGREVFDALKGAADAVKDVKEHFQLKDADPKLVDLEWPQKSGFMKRAEADGYTIAWSRPDKVASREIDGYEVMYEIDENERTRRKLVLRDGLVLIGRKG